jgi:hypothetical protein
MTKRTKRITAVAVLVLALSFCWTHSVQIADIATPGYCKIATNDGTQQLSTNDAIKTVEALWKSDHKLKRESLSCTYWPTGGFGSQEIDKIGLTPRALQCLTQ